MKYNWSIIGHESQLMQIENDIESGNLAHAYLLAGTNSVGKFTVAKKLAGILQCEKDFCHECNACVQVQKGCHIDTIEFRDEGESIKIEEVRGVIERLSMTRQSKYKILLIQSLERMGREAANSFLKTLEEPPSRTIFIMTTDNMGAVLPTIISRVRVLQFGCVSQEYLLGKLAELYPGALAETLEKVGVFSLGKTGKALQLMENPEVLANYLKTYHDVQNFLGSRNLAERFGYVADLSLVPGQTEMFLDILMHVLRAKMLEGAGDEGRWAKTLAKVSQTAGFLGKNINSRLALENLMLEL